MLEEKILEDYKLAMKAKDTLKSSVLSFLRAQILNAAISKKKDKLDDMEALAVIKKQVQAHQESIEQFKKGNREDLVQKEERELEVLKLYLPPPLPEEEIQKIIDEVVLSTGAQGLKEMGKVMKEVNARTGPAADGKLVSELVRKKLSNF
jgi:uncharacterized protein